MEIINTRVELTHSEPKEIESGSWHSELQIVWFGEPKWFGDVYNDSKHQLESFLAHFDALPSMAKAIDAYVRLSESKGLNSKDHEKKLEELQELMRIAHEKMHNA